MHFNDITYMNGCVSHQTEELDTCRYYYHWQPSSSGPGDRQHDNMSMMLKAPWSLCQISLFMKLETFKNDVLVSEPRAPNPKRSLVI